MILALLLAQAPFALAQAADGADKDEVTLVREAFESPYGKALTAELGKSLRASADPACLADKGVTADQIEPRGRDIILKWGTRMMVSASALAVMEAQEKFLDSHPSKALERLLQCAARYFEM